MSERATRGVQVEARSFFVPERSSEAHNHYFFAYRIRITNVGERTVQLLSRHWIVTDANGETEEVRGEGVVGAQPVLRPGQSFEYTSFCPLPTPVGAMHGSYQLVTDEGEAFEAEIPAFTLAVPHTLN